MNLHKGERVPPPPLIYLGCLAIGLVLDRLLPLPFLPDALRYWIAIPILAAGITLVAFVLKEVSRSKTSIVHHKPTTELITSGPFRYSRNPIYVGLTLFVAGISIALGSTWGLLMTVPAVLATHFLVVLREEAFLSAKFGDAYLDYQAEVRRWI